MYISAQHANRRSAQIDTARSLCWIFTRAKPEQVQACHINT